MIKIKLNRMILSCVSLCLLFLLHNSEQLHAQQFTIDRIWTSDFNGNEKTNFVPNGSIRYNIDVVMDVDARVEANGDVTGEKINNQSGKNGKWKTKLRKQKNDYSSGRNTISWFAIIPNNAKLDSLAVVKIKTKAKINQNDGGNSDDDSKGKGKGKGKDKNSDDNDDDEEGVDEDDDDNSNDDTEIQ